VRRMIKRSFNFAEPEGQLLQVQGRSSNEVRISLERVLRTLRITGTEHKDVAFVIDGLALELALKYHYEAFTELAMLSKTALCCRVTPFQKAQVQPP
jgi:phospholipid-translocating ATPase